MNAFKKFWQALTAKGPLGLPRLVWGILALAALVVIAHFLGDPPPPTS